MANIDVNLNISVEGMMIVPVEVGGARARGSAVLTRIFEVGASLPPPLA